MDGDEMKRIRLITREDVITHFNSHYYKEAATGCWIWTGGKTGAGYGIISYNKGHHIYTHRLSYEISHGPIMFGQVICHRCDNPRCVNPQHLFIGTQADNLTDGRKKGRMVPPPHRPGESSGHSKLTESDVREIRRALCAGETRTAIARQYAVKPGTIWFIETGRTWRHVA